MCYTCLSIQLCKVDHINRHALLCTFLGLDFEGSINEGIEKRTDLKILKYQVPYYM